MFLFDNDKNAKLMKVSFYNFDAFFKKEGVTTQ